MARSLLERRIHHVLPHQTRLVRLIVRTFKIYVLPSRLVHHMIRRLVDSQQNLTCIRFVQRPLLRAILSGPALSRPLNLSHAAMANARAIRSIRVTPPPPYAPHRLHPPRTEAPRRSLSAARNPAHQRTTAARDGAYGSGVVLPVRWGRSGNSSSLVIVSSL